MMKNNRFFQRKVMAIVVAFVAVFAVYQYNSISVQRTINYQNVVFTRVDIPPHTEITKEMVFTRRIPNEAIPPNAIRNPQQVVGLWTVDGYGISRNSFVFDSKLVHRLELPDAGLLNLTVGEFAFPLLVDIETSIGNAIRPNTYVDLYFATTDKETGKPMFGPLAERIKITSVKDSRTSEVFTPDNYTEVGNVARTANNPAMARLYTLAVDIEQLELLNKAKMLGHIIPIASGTSYIAPDDLKSEHQLGNGENKAFIQRWIGRNTVNALEDILLQEVLEGEGNQ